MMLRDVGRSLAGAAVVYVAMAACSAASTAPSPAALAHDGGGGQTADANTDGSGGAPGGNDGAPGGADGQAGSFLDALVDPVSDALADGPPTSGTRLKAKWRIGDDGSREFNGWHDSQLVVDCVFMRMTGGEHRCLPVETATVVGTNFEDASCTQEIAVLFAAQNCPSVPKYASRTNVGGCAAAPTWRVYELGAEVPLTDTYVLSGTSCNKQDYTGSGYRFFHVNSEASPSVFVGSHIEIDP